MFRVNAKFILLIALSIILGSCGPFYRTRHNYIPPSTHRGLACVNQCVSDKQMCGSNCNNQAHSCQYLKEIQAQNEYNAYIRENCHEVLEYSEHQHANVLDYNKRGEVKKQMKCKDPFPKQLKDFRKTYECDSQNRSCADHCNNLYNDCYRNCGGRIEVVQEQVTYY